MLLTIPNLWKTPRCRPLRWHLLTLVLAAAAPLALRIEAAKALLLAPDPAA